ncbi:hypothetical protein KAH94_00770 [bacterium]|nr:hypothetical protein [bacterium]
MSLKQGLATVWLLAVITVLKTFLVLTLCKVNIETKKTMLCNKKITKMLHIQT